MSGNWKGRGGWYSAVVVEAHDDGTYTVVYDDEDEEDIVDAKQVSEKALS